MTRGWDQMGFGEWLGVAIFFVGIPVAWWLGRKNRQRPTVRYGIDEQELVRADDALSRGGLEIRFRERRVERLCRSYFAFWLQSGDPVSGSALPKTDPLGVDLIDGDRVLSARVVAESRSQIGVSVTVDGAQRGVNIAFEFLDVGDGFVVEVLHEIHAPPHLRGSIPGAKVVSQSDVDLSPKGRENLRRSWWVRMRNRYRSEAIAAVLGGFIVMVGLTSVGLLDALGVPWRARIGVAASEPPKFDGWQVCLYSLTVFVLIFFLWDFTKRFRRRVPRSVVSNDYEAAFDWSPAPSYLDGSDRVFRVGDMIQHRDFGTGVINRIVGEGDKLILIVSFEVGGTKKLLAKIAPIAFVTNVHGEND
jgi:hypothetical protein